MREQAHQHVARACILTPRSFGAVELRPSPTGGSARPTLLCRTRDSAVARPAFARSPLPLRTPRRSPRFRSTVLVHALSPPPSFLSTRLPLPALLLPLSLRAPTALPEPFLSAYAPPNLPSPASPPSPPPSVHFPGRHSARTCDDRAWSPPCPSHGDNVLVPHLATCFHLARCFTGAILHSMLGLW